jgi:hypothetical protein
LVVSLRLNRDISETIKNHLDCFLPGFLKNCPIMSGRDREVRHKRIGI